LVTQSLRGVATNDLTSLNHQTQQLNSRNYNHQMSLIPMNNNNFIRGNGDQSQQSRMNGNYNNRQNRRQYQQNKGSEQQNGNKDNNALQQQVNGTTPSTNGPSVEQSAVATANAQSPSVSSSQQTPIIAASS